MKLLNESNRIQDPPKQGTLLKWSIWNDIIHVDNDYCVLFNTVSRNAVLTEASYLGKTLNDVSDEERNILYQLAIIVDASRDEMEEQQERFNRGKEDLSYIDLTILVTHNCQMRCTYCFEGNKDNTSIDDNIATQIIKLLEDNSKTCQRLRVTWFGGEPLLAYDKIKHLSNKIMAFCKSNNVSYVADITTNGYALTNSRCQELVEYLNVKRFIITLDVLAHIHYKRRPLVSGRPTFERIWNNIHSLVDYGAKVTIRMTIDRENHSSVPDFLNYLAVSRLKGRVGLSFCRTIDLNYTPEAVKPQLYSEAEWSEVEWELIQMAHDLGLWSYQFPHAAPLGGCLRSGDITIAATGLIYKCLDTVGDKRWICGSIAQPNKYPIPAWYKKWLDWNPMSNTICRNCVLQPLCNGGCPHNALYRDKKHGTSLQCPDWKANYRKQIIEIAKTYDDKKI